MKKMKWIIAALAACALALAATGCDDGFTEAALNAMQNNAEQESGTPKPNTCEHYYDENKCTKCGLKRPSLPGGWINNYGVLTKYTGTETEVDIPDGVTSIGSSAFWGCTSLASVKIPDGVTSIERYAFYGCTSLESVTIPTNMERIGYGAFSGCSNLSKVKYTGTLAEWCAVDGLYEVMSRATTVTVGEDERDLKGMTELVIPEGVKSIGQYAFYGCAGLTSVTIPASVTSIESRAFSRCSSLKEIEFGGTVAQWKAVEGSDNVNVHYIQCSDGHIGVKDVPAYLKMSGTKVTGYTDSEEFPLPKDLAIPDGVTAIEKYAFYNCKILESVTIGNGVKSIGQYAFSWCTNLTSVTIPDGVTSIEWGAFWWCTSLASVTIPGSVESIGANAFYGCASLASVTIGNGVKSIGDSAFYGCTSLATINYTGTEEQWNAITKGSYWDSGTGNYTITYNYTE